MVANLQNEVRSLPLWSPLTCKAPWLLLRENEDLAIDQGSLMAFAPCEGFRSIPSPLRRGRSQRRLWAQFHSRRLPETADALQVHCSMDDVINLASLQWLQMLTASHQIQISRSQGSPKVLPIYELAQLSSVGRVTDRATIKVSVSSGSHRKTHSGNAWRQLPSLRVFRKQTVRRSSPRALSQGTLARRLNASPRRALPSSRNLPTSAWPIPIGEACEILGPRDLFGKLDLR